MSGWSVFIVATICRSRDGGMSGATTCVSEMKIALIGFTRGGQSGIDIETSRTFGAEVAFRYPIVTSVSPIMHKIADVSDETESIFKVFRPTGGMLMMTW